MKISKIGLNCRKNDLAQGTDQIFFLFRSPVVFSVNGRETALKANSAVLMTNSYSYSFRSSVSQPLKYDFISLRLSSADRQYISSMSFPLDTPVQLNDSFIISNTLKSMKAKSLQKGKHFSEFMELSMRIIFISMCDAENGKSIPAVSKYAELKAIRESVYDEPMNNWTIEEVCYETGMSRTYFHRLYMQAFGVSFRQDVIQSRLLYASQLLTDTDMSVSEISEKCGYESDSYFMRQFRQHKGCTPSQFRKNSKTE